MVENTFVLSGKFKFIAEHYGDRIIEQQLIEEMSELTKAILKKWRVNGEGMETSATKEDVEQNLYEELADVSVCLQELIYLYHCSGIVNEVRIAKANRTIERMTNR